EAVGDDRNPIGDIIAIGEGVSMRIGLSRQSSLAVVLTRHRRYAARIDDVRKMMAEDSIGVSKAVGLAGAVSERDEVAVGVVAVSHGVAQGIHDVCDPTLGVALERDAEAAAGGLVGPGQAVGINDDRIAIGIGDTL